MITDKLNRGGSYVPSVNHLLFLMNVCTAFESNIFWAWSFWESPNNNVLISLRKLWCFKKLKRTVLCSIYKRQLKKVVSVHPDKSTNTSRIRIILDRNRSYFRELQLRRNLAYKNIGSFSQYNFSFKVNFKRIKCSGLVVQTVPKFYDRRDERRLVYR